MQKKMTMNVEKLIGVRELAEWLGETEKTIYWLNTSGKGPKRRKVGKHVKYVPSDVLEWLEQQTVLPGEA